MTASTPSSSGADTSAGADAPAVLPVAQAVGGDAGAADREVVRPAILLVSAPESGERMRAEFAARYDVDYDLRWAGSADDAEALVRDLLGAGRPIAMVATTQSLPDATYDDLLADLRPLCPSSRRVLVLDWAAFTADDRDRIYAALGEGVIDAYLGLPRGVRDEEFHTAVSELLSEWGWTSHPPEVEQVGVVVRDPSARLMRLKDVFGRMGVALRKYTEDSPVGAAIVAEGERTGQTGFPLVRVAGTVLSDPTFSQVAEVMFGGPESVPAQVFDLAVVGSGPAGLAAAVYGASEGLSTVVVESEAVGGQAGSSSMIRNYLGFPRGISGMRLAQRARFQAGRFGAHFLIGHHVEALDLGRDGAPHALQLPGGQRIEARAVVVATGAKYRTSGVESVEELVGMGVHYGAAMSVAQGLRDTKVFVVGGGNSAGQAAVHMSRYTGSVTMLVRRPGLSETMSDYLVREVEANPRITVRTCTQVVDAGANAQGRLSWLQLRDTRTGSEQRVRAGALLLLLGAEPCSGWLPEGIHSDERGFVLTGRDVPKDAWAGGVPPSPHATSVPGVFAVGDIRAGSMKRVASASGEGASVVPAVHAWLAEQHEASDL